MQCHLHRCECYKLSDESCKDGTYNRDTYLKIWWNNHNIVTQHSTETAVERAKLYEDIGADCLMLLPPFFLKPDAAALYDHMKAVGQAVSIPVMAQYAPEQTGVAIQPAVFAKLFNEVPNICYYKIECKPAGSYVSTLLTATENKVGAFIGNAGYQSNALTAGYWRNARMLNV